jgi:uncharacterized glyoxalase superfamily protein PhnB
METVSPNIFVNDLQATIEYYQKLDFQVVTSVPDESGKMIFVLMMNGTATFMFQTFKSIENQLHSISRNNGGSLLLYIKMKGIRSFFEQVKERVNILTGLEKTFYGATEFSVLDPNDFMLTFAEDE